MPQQEPAWPALPDTWGTTEPTLHMWLQMVGKVRLALAPLQNHYWQVALYVSARGLTTSPIPYESEAFEIELQFQNPVHQQLRCFTTWGRSATLPLYARSVSDFYREFMSVLRELNIEVRIWPCPVEVADPIRFDQDHGHCAYDPRAAHAYWRVLLQADRIFKRFQSRFLGKSSPVHFFWGSPDLAVTRFSGRKAPTFTGTALNVNPKVMQESYSHEVSSAGFWAGSAQAPPALFYSYAVPQPAGFPKADVSPAEASYDDALGEFVLPYPAVRSSDNPDETLLEFLGTTYAAAATLGHWDRALLER